MRFPTKLGQRLALTSEYDLKIKSKQVESDGTSSETIKLRPTYYDTII